MSTDMQDETQSVTRVREFLRTLRKFWHVVVITALIGALAGYMWARLQPERFQSTAVAFVTTSNSSDLQTQMVADAFIKSKATQYSDLASSHEVAADAIKRSGVKMTPDEALTHLTVTVPKNTPQLKISVQAASAADAARLADSWVAALNAQLTGVEGAPKKVAANEGTGLSGASIQIRQYAQAQAPSSPAYPNRKLSTLIGALAALSMVLLSLYIRSLLDRRIRSAAVIQDRMKLTVIGTVPEDNSIGGGTRLVNMNNDAKGNEHFHVRESFKELRTNLRFMNPDNPMRIVTVTSSLPSEGKSTVAGNLAMALADEGRPTVLVDGDLRRPTVAETFGVLGNVGIAGAVVGDVDVEEVMQEVYGAPNLSIIAAGQIPPNPSELLSSDRFEAIIRKLAETHIVVIDAPPLLAVTDAAIIAARFQGALLVVSAATSKIDELQQAIRTLKNVHAPIVGAVLNRVPRKGGDARAYQYYGKDYYYRSADGEKTQRRRNGSGSSSVRKSFAKKK